MQVVSCHFENSCNGVYIGQIFKGLGIDCNFMNTVYTTMIPWPSKKLQLIALFLYKYTDLKKNQALKISFRIPFGYLL